MQRRILTFFISIFYFLNLYQKREIQCLEQIYGERETHFILHSLEDKEE